MQHVKKTEWATVCGEKKHNEALQLRIISIYV